MPFKFLKTPFEGLVDLPGHPGLKVGVDFLVPGDQIVRGEFEPETMNQDSFLIRIAGLKENAVLSIYVPEALFLEAFERRANIPEDKTDGN